MQTNDMDGISNPVPLTPKQQAAYERKVVIANQHSTSLVAARSGRAAAAAATSGYVGTWERQQTLSYYCGPTAVQVVADYAWQTGASTVKYTQKYISDHWTHTTTAGTSIVNVAAGLNGALNGSPRELFTYWAVRPTSGADWYNYLYTDIIIGMPQVANVSPWESSTYHLKSWTSPASTGHYVVQNGWNQAWDGTTTPTVRYDDGSGGYGGGTGTYTDRQTVMWYVIVNHNRYVIW